VDFTVAICTHDRAAALDVTLGTLSHLSAPGITYEILLVDNASTDETPAVAAQWRDRGLPLRVVSESTLGLSSARNRAIEEAIGSYILFLDDDVSVGPGLLAAYHRTAGEFPDAPFMGGPIVPVFEGEATPLARAILEAKPGAYSALNLGESPQFLEPTAGPWGANCCIRRACIGAERFDQRLCYVGRGGIVGDEVEFLTRIAQRCGPGRWVPDASLQHRIPVSRATWSFLERHARGSGRTQMRHEMLHEGHQQVSLRTVLQYERRFLSHWMDNRRGSAGLADQVRLRYSVWKERGRADEARDMWLGRSPIANQRAPRP
jgi:glycosyltransferase involved in cell wall biosynthesis